jgi:hypothetical protein
MQNKTFNSDCFFSFEERNKCFDYKVGGIYFWDLIRHEVYYDIYRGNIPNENERSSSLILAIFKFIKESYFFTLFLFFKKWDYIFFTASRNKFDNNKYFDQSLGDVLAKYKKKAISFESFQRDNNKWQYKNTLFNPIGIIDKLSSKFIKNQDYSSILNVIKEEYKDSNFTNQTINNIVKKHKIELYFYSILFKLKSPKIIFLSQSGSQKALFLAAKKNIIPVVEVQHGVINAGHMLYSYSNKINYKSDQIYLPTYFFVFSEFWKKQVYYPVKKIMCMGNSFFYELPSKVIGTSVIKDGLTVASANIYGVNLKKIVIELASQNSVIPIYFKLHPNQYSEKEDLIADFLPFKNVYVFSSEKSMDELIALSKAVLVIQSTALYESLHRKRIGIIYKKQSYEEHNHVFGNPNVFLVDSAKQVIEAMNHSFVEDAVFDDLFFKDFDHKLFEQFISDLNIGK